VGSIWREPVPSYAISVVIGSGASVNSVKCFITCLLLSLTVKEFWKSVNIWQSYGQEYRVSYIFYSRVQRRESGLISHTWVRLS